MRSNDAVTATIGGSGASRLEGDAAATHSWYVLNELFVRSGGSNGETVVSSPRFHRRRLDLGDGTEMLLDTFPDVEGATCCSLRVSTGRERLIRLIVHGVHEWANCAAGGWLLKPAESSASSYWMPQPPCARTVDSHGRILSQQFPRLEGSGATAEGLWFDVHVPQGMHLDIVVWRFAGTLDVKGPLQESSTLERQPWFMRSSHTSFNKVADLYLCLVHGHVYDNRFVWRRMWGGFRWRICSENEALSLYVVLDGLERATGHALHTLLKRQVLFSIIARQAPDGAWYHGEWTDLMESHFRLHNAGVLLLEAALEEFQDPVVARSLEAAVSFAAGRTDQTDLGLWFLHDSLEESVEATTAKDAPPWTPTRMLGASPTNKLILNTHLDAIVALDRYRELTGDMRHASVVASALGTARAVLAMHPAEWLYRAAFAAVRLTLLPSEQVNRLSLALRAIRRVAREYLNPRIFRLKHRYPRFVMPGGLVDRHLSPKHFDMGYHPVNLLDVVRLSRRFRDDHFHKIITDGVLAVTKSGLLRFWVESKHRQPVGYWVEAIYHLCMLDRSPAYRAYLAEAMLAAADAGVGLSPSLLGADAEAVAFAEQVPCPSPRDDCLRIANLSHAGKLEFLVVNTATEAIDLVWQHDRVPAVAWVSDDDKATGRDGGLIVVPPRQWLLGR